MEKEKKSWLKSLIFEDTEPKSKEVRKETVKNTASSTELTSTRQPPVIGLQRIEPIDTGSSTSEKSSEGKVDRNLLNKLSSVLDEKQSPGIDYIRFKSSVDSLKSIQSDENMRFVTAFMALKATNTDLSKQYLLETTDKYIGLMENERQAGMSQLSNLRKNEIDKKEKEIAESAAKVKKLKEEIAKSETFIAETSAEIVLKRNEIDDKEADFNATVDMIVNQLKSDKNKIQNLIQ